MSNTINKKNPILKETIKNLLDSAGCSIAENTKTRIFKRLLSINIKYVKDLIIKKEEDVLAIDHFGKCCLRFLNNLLDKHDLSFGMTIVDDDAGENKHTYQKEDCTAYKKEADYWRDKFFEVENLFNALEDALEKNYYKIIFKVHTLENGLSENVRIVFCAHPRVAVEIIKNMHRNEEGIEQIEFLSIKKLG